MVRKGEVSKLLLVIMVVGSISSTLGLTLFMLDRLRILPFQIFPGYEGSYMQIAGYSTNFPKDIVAKVGDPKPEEASQWTLSPNYLNIDPDAQADGVQNLIVAGLSYGGRIEMTPYGTVISDGPVKWSKTWVEGDRTFTRSFEARIYYFTHKLYMTTKFDENLFLGIGTTEKGCPVQNSKVFMHVSVVNWQPLGNDTANTGAWLLAVEVAEVRYWKTDNTGGGARLSEGLPEGSTASLGFAQGQTLTLSNSMTELGGSGVLGKEYIAELSQRQPDMISPDPRLRQAAYISLPINELGAKGGNCYFASPFLVGNNPLVDVTLRIHVLKVDSWIAVQTRGSEPKPPYPPGGTKDNPVLIAWDNMVRWFGETFGLPLEIAGYVLIALVIMFIAGVLFILFLAIAVRVGVARE
ncbi:MAG: hypothetical protein QXH59_08235 [Candidatus Caldarchaeum sp.]